MASPILNAILIFKHYPSLFLPSIENTLSEGKSIFSVGFYNQGIREVGYLVSKEGVFLKSDKILNSSFCYSFGLMGVVDAIPKEWRSMIKTNPSCAPSALDQTRFELIIAGKMTDLANVTSKLVSESHSFCLLIFYLLVIVITKAAPAFFYSC